jgi:hypothetical protein
MGMIVGRLISKTDNKLVRDEPLLVRTYYSAVMDLLMDPTHTPQVWQFKRLGQSYRW